MNVKFILNLAIISCLVTACGSQLQGNFLRDDDKTGTASAPQETALRDDDSANAYDRGLLQAKMAAALAQSAKTESEWKAVAEDWNKAIALMKTVPKSDPNYASANQKISEYQKNLDAVQKKAKVTGLSPK